MQINRVVQWAASYILLIISTAFLFKGFMTFNWNTYMIAFAILVLFIIVNRVTSKRIKCDDGYTLAQAVFFYRSCLKQGVDGKSLSRKDKDILIEISKQYDYSEDLTEAQLELLYKTGRELYKEIKK